MRDAQAPRCERLLSGLTHGGPPRYRLSLAGGANSTRAVSAARVARRAFELNPRLLNECAASVRRVCEPKRDELC